MPSHVYLQYHPMQSCAAIDPSAGFFALPFKTPAHRPVNHSQQADNILRENHARLVLQNKSLQSEIDNDTEERRRLRRQSEELQSKVETLQKDHEKKVSESPAHRQLVQKNQELLNDNDSLRSKIDNDAEEIGKLRIQNEELQSEFKTLQKDHEKKVLELRENDKTIEYFKRNKNEASEEYDKLHRRALQCQRERQQRDEKVKELNEALKLKDKQHDSDKISRESAIHVLREKMSGMESKVDKLQEVLRLKDIQLARIEGFQEVRSRIIAISETQISKLQSKVDEYELENKNLRKENEELKHKYDDDH